MYDIPSNLKYTNSHIWVENIGKNNFRVGVTDFAQDELGDIVFIELPIEGKEYSQADECAVIESVKSTSDIYCPLSGVVRKINTELEENPDLINSDPYSEGWIFLLETTDDTELDGFTVGIGYQRDVQNDAFVRVEANYMQFDGASLTSSSGSQKITIDHLDGVTAAVSLGKSF